MYQACLLVCKHLLCIQAVSCKKVPKVLSSNDCCHYYCPVSLSYQKRVDALYHAHPSLFWYDMEILGLFILFFLIMFLIPYLEIFFTIVGSYQKRYEHAHTHSFIFWYDNNSGQYRRPVCVSPPRCVYSC